MLTVNELRKLGYQVRVRHNRCFRYEPTLGSATWKAIPKSKGGSTEVVVTTPGEFPMTNVLGVAECSPKDDYNKKLGVRIALGRALLQLGMETK